jgi:pectate lyase
MRNYWLPCLALALLNGACGGDDESTPVSGSGNGGTGSPVAGSSASSGNGLGLGGSGVGGAQGVGGSAGSSALPGGTGGTAGATGGTAGTTGGTAAAAAGAGATSGGSGGVDPSGGSAGSVAVGGSSGGAGAPNGGSGGGGPVTIRPPKLEGYGSKTTGGKGGAMVTATTGTEIHQAICQRAADDTPLIILVNGVITPGNTTKQSGSCNTADGVIELKEIKNISLIGVGTNGVLDQIGVHVRSAANIIIQNLTIKNVRKSNTSTPSNGGDAIGMESDVSNVWVDHNLIFGSTTMGEEHDGLLDFKDNCRDITISYNHFHTGGRGGLIGSNDNGDDGSTNLTFHHNWYENLNSRAHMVREAQAHFYNNYYSKILGTGLNVRNGAKVLVEGNYFTEARNPLGTFFFLDNNPVYQVRDNFFTSSVVWEAAAEERPAGPNVMSTGSVSVPYTYALDPAQGVPDIVRANVGVGKI